MKFSIGIFPFFALLSFHPIDSLSQGNAQKLSFDFYGDTIELPLDQSVIVNFTDTPSSQSVQTFYSVVNAGKYEPIINILISFKEKHQLNDWFYYQLIRKTAQQIGPKAENYPRYTLYKWFLLAKSGFDAHIAISNHQLIFYVQSDENIVEDKIYETNVYIPEAKKALSYKVTQMPNVAASEYSEKEIQFTYRNKTNRFKVMVNPQVQNIFVNYPVVDFESYFNIPLSRQTYSSLIPLLKENIKWINQKKGVDYLMRFTRYAFLYENDQENFGKEKRLSPEQTLLTEHSDCDDRAALFFYLVKEIYDLPMIELVYPSDVTIAAKLKKPTSRSIVYKGDKYSVCEPAPQLQDLRLGELPSHLRNLPFQVAYEYVPRKK